MRFLKESCLFRFHPRLPTPHCDLSPSSTNLHMCSKPTLGFYASIPFKVLSRPPATFSSLHPSTGLARLLQPGTMYKVTFPLSSHTTKEELLLQTPTYLWAPSSFPISGVLWNKYLMFSHLTAFPDPMLSPNHNNTLRITEQHRE